MTEQSWHSDGPFSGVMVGQSDQPLWTSKDVAVYLGIHEKTVREMAGRGDLPCLHFGRLVRFVKEDIVKAGRGNPGSARGMNQA